MMKEYIEKVKVAYREFKKKCKIKWLKAKYWCRTQVIKFERKRGLAERCAWCDERIFCETFCGTPEKKHFWERPKRCTDHQSTR